MIPKEQAAFVQNPCEFDLKLNNGAILVSPSSKLYSVMFGEILGGRGRRGEGRGGEGRGDVSDLFNVRFFFSI